MLSEQENEPLCRAGSGTPMGDLMRQYWIPALLPSELPAADGPPIRVRLLGENLIAFRTTSGKAGLIQNACPHRGASLFFGRDCGAAILPDGVNGVDATWDILYGRAQAIQIPAGGS